MFKSILEFKAAKAEQKKITMVTCYDATSAQLIARSHIDCVLIGDSVAMTMHGFNDTTHATVEMIAMHVAAVRRGLGKDGFIIGDLPFLEHRGSQDRLIAAAQTIVRAGANALKIEGVDGSEQAIENLIQAGVPVMGHLGLTPQSLNSLGGFKVQAKSPEAKAHLLRQSHTLEKLGAFALVLECVPSDIAAQTTAELTIPTIGIGAGHQTNGQVLVWQDLLGLNTTFKPKFVRRFAELEHPIVSALNQFHQQTLSADFPSESESYQ